ncbi:hypothetical protein [Prosthecobacter sp.]
MLISSAVLIPDILPVRRAAAYLSVACPGAGDHLRLSKAVETHIYTLGLDVVILPA